MAEIIDREDMEEIGKEAESITLDEFLSGLKEIEQVSFNDLKAAAAHYLAITKKLAFQLSDFTSVLQRQREIRHSLGKGINPMSVESYVQNKQRIQGFLNSEIPKELYEESFKFQMILNNFLGTSVEMVMVVEGDTGPILYRIMSDDVLKYDYSSSDQLIGRYNATVQTLEQCCQKIELDTSKMNFSLPGLNTTYQQVMFRYEIGRKKKTHLVMWKPNGVWKKMSVSAKGDINEAYGAFVFLNKAEPPFNKDLELNIEDFMIYGVANVDNISGLLKGDVSVNNLEIGIKSANASTLGLAQIIDIAEKILDENFAEEDLAKIKQQMINDGKIRNKIIDTSVKGARSVMSSISKYIS